MTASATWGWGRGGEGGRRREERDLLHLVEEGSLLLVAARGVDDDNVVAGLLELLHALRRDLDGVALRVRAVEGDLGARRVLRELIERAGTERVGTDHGGTIVLAPGGMGRERRRGGEGEEGERRRE